MSDEKKAGETLRDVEAYLRDMVNAARRAAIAAATEATNRELEREVAERAGIADTETPR